MYEFFSELFRGFRGSKSGTAGGTPAATTGMRICFYSRHSRDSRAKFVSGIERAVEGNGPDPIHFQEGTIQTRNLPPKRIRPDELPGLIGKACAQLRSVCGIGCNRDFRVIEDIVDVKLRGPVV